MLNAYVKRSLTRERYRSRPAGPHLDAFMLWLEQRGYQPRRILRLIRGVHRFSQWAQENGLGVEELDAKALEQFRDHLQGRQPNGQNIQSSFSPTAVDLRQLQQEVL
jgi:hypothetical protein